MTKKILVTGTNGQLGSEIKNNPNRKNQYIFTDVSDLDITDKQAVSDFIKQNEISVIVNCAAYTQVDKAEDDRQTATLINHTAVRTMAEICKEENATFIHISTDYVFDGTKNTPCSETETTNPVNFYGKTKLEGEIAIKEVDIQHLIIRTSWLYSLDFGQNFVKTIQRLSAERDELKVVFDQTGTPTNARDLANFIIHVIENNLYEGKKETYHFSNEGVCTWFDFATEIVRQSNHKCKVTPCLSEAFPTKAKRPIYSVLDKSKLKTDFNYEIPYWRDSLKIK